MNHEASLSRDPIVLAQETIRFGGMILHYRLAAYHSQTERFRIRVETGGEAAESSVGSDIETALRAYRMILGGRVTPCVLEDVMYDLRSV